MLGLRLPRHELIFDTPLDPARGTVIDLAGDAEPRATAVAWADRVDVVTARPVRADGPFAGVTAVLVRPDGHVAWTTGCGTGAADALRRWFGAESPLRTIRRNDAQHVDRGPDGAGIR